MKTVRLFDENSYLAEFKATVLSCEEENGRYKVVLDRTAFFPEGGGQTADTGLIDGIEVLDCQEKDEVIYHFLSAPLTVGAEIQGEIDFAVRYKKMQIHSGEHIVSGVMHRTLGLSNVGFHLGSSEVTLDFDAVLTREQLNEVETKANEIIYKNVPIVCYYPSEDELSELDYRSKKELNGDVRIVDIKGYDVCACCAPHVKNTGEVGIIKLTHFEKNKNGTRITMLCATDALYDYREKFRNVAAISALLCAKPDETAKAVENLLNQNAELSREITDLKRTLSSLKADAVEKSDEPLIVFEDGLTIADMRAFANKVIEKRPSVYIFTPSAKGGYTYLCAGSQMKAFLEKIKTLRGGGGGSDQMIQGSVMATENELKEFLATNIDK